MDYEERWPAMSAPELELAATVTRAAVRCSAWLGVIGFSVFSLFSLVMASRSAVGLEKLKRDVESAKALALAAALLGCLAA